MIVVKYQGTAYTWKELHQDENNWSNICNPQNKWAPKKSSIFYLQ